MSHLESATMTADHREIGKQLNLFSFHQQAPAIPIFHPKGMASLNALIEFSRKENARRGYQEIQTPQIMDIDLWRRSEHLKNYKDNMFFTQLDDDRKCAIKPMNCPGCMLFYKSQHFSYRDLPLKISELGRVHRREASGVSHGLMRVRGFTQDDAHIFCANLDQLRKEVIACLEMISYVYSVFGFHSVKFEISGMPDKHIGQEEVWVTAENILKDALAALGHEYQYETGTGAFYGPKIDCHIEDSGGRSWQLGTIQVDFFMPNKFGLKFASEDNSLKEPLMVHRAIMGSIERFYGVLLEHYEGALPAWLHPIQVKLLSVDEPSIPYARSLENNLLKLGARVEVDMREERLGKKIRDARLEKIPYVAVIGQQEAEHGHISMHERQREACIWVDQEDFLRQVEAAIRLPLSG